MNETCKKKNTTGAFHNYAQDGRLFHMLFTCDKTSQRISNDYTMNVFMKSPTMKESNKDRFIFPNFHCCCFAELIKNVFAQTVIYNKICTPPPPPKKKKKKKEKKKREEGKVTTISS